jgi:hypothetical protein
MEHQANERIEHGLKRQKGRQSPIKHRASIRERHRNDHIGDQRGLQLKKITLTPQKRHAQQVQNFKSDRLLGAGGGEPPLPAGSLRGRKIPLFDQQRDRTIFSRGDSR